MLKRRSLASSCLSFSFLMSVALFQGCGTEMPKKELTLFEQIEVDTKSAEGLTQEFVAQASYINLPSAQSFVRKTAKLILSKRPDLKDSSIQIKIHDDSDPKYRRFFSFPGITLSVPFSFLKKVEFENELAAALSFELANVLNRFLAKKVEVQMIAQHPLELFSKNSVFNLSKSERSLSIKLGSKLIYDAGYDARGMASIFKRYNVYYLQDGASDLKQNQVGFNVREAQRANSEFLPQIKPVVRSAEFIQFKKGITDAHKRDLRGSKERNGS